eukprot:5917208-Pyramimonas_sp.AAC.1
MRPDIQEELMRAWRHGYCADAERVKMFASGYLCAKRKDSARGHGEVQQVITAKLVRIRPLCRYDALPSIAAARIHPVVLGAAGGEAAVRRMLAQYPS